jgi:hypothetical protein
MQSRGVAPRFYRSVLDERAQMALWDAHIETLAVWRGVAQALAHSGIPEDRTMAMAIVDFVQHMPAHISRGDSAVSMAGQPNLIRHLTETERDSASLVWVSGTRSCVHDACRRERRLVCKRRGHTGVVRLWYRWRLAPGKARRPSIWLAHDVG